jgi:DNA-binding protein Fis
MAGSSSVFTILLLTADAEVQAQLRQAFKEASVTVVRDAAAFQKEAAKHQFDAVVIESRAGHEGMGVYAGHVDPSRTLVIAGSRSVLKKTVKTIQLLTQQNGHPPPQGKLRDASLESYLEMKMGDFVKGMRTGSAKNLHPILISAVERPLITSALHETRGNQIQAAELLGLNRNTLRKKIAELHIPLKRTNAKARRLT